MDGGPISKTRQAEASAPSAPVRRKPVTRPGLPLSPAALGGTNAPQSLQDLTGLQGTRGQDAREDQSDSPSTGEAQTEAPEGQPAEQGALSPETGEAAGREGAEAADGGASDQPQDGTEVPRPRAGPARPIKPSKLPPIPAVRLPDLSGMRSPVVPPPPKSAEDKRFDILKSTGMLPADHHAAVQRKVDTTTALARQAQSHVIFQTGTIAARAKSRIVNLSHQVPPVVGGGIARIRAAATTAQTAIDEITDRQIRAVIDKANETQTTMEGEQADVAQQMHDQLMLEASPALVEAKEKLNAELTGLLTQARAKIAGIKTGTEPTPFALNTPPEPSPDPDHDAGENAPPSPPTWDQAEADLSAKLSTGNETNLTEFANLRVSSALPGMVNPIQQSYDQANDATAEGLDSSETRLQLFNQTFDLIAPTQRRIEGHVDPVSDEMYIGNLSEDLSLAYDRLDSDAKRVVRQLDEKRTVLKDQTLNPDYAESQPHKAIEGLQTAGKKVEDGIRHQAAMIEATLKANLAALAAEYPDIVARLTPLVMTGGFLEATEVLRQMADAQASIGILQDGQLAQVAEQAEAAVRQAQTGLKDQLDGLRKSAQDSCGSIGETQARVTYSIIQTGAEYTGIIDEGLADAIPQILSHADRLAKNLLAPDKEKDGQLSTLKDAALRFMNGVLAGEWGRYTAQLMGLEEQLGGVQTSVLNPVLHTDKPMGMVRQGVVTDAIDRAHKVQEALEPRPMTNDERLLAYGAAIALSPFTLGGSIAVVGYEYASDPNESDVVAALSVPPPGPMGIEEAQTGSHPFRNSESLIHMIEDRMTTEGEQQDILNLFSPDADVSRQAKNNLFAGADSWGGISQEAAMGLMQSLGPAEIASSIMTPEENARMAKALEDTLDDPTDREIAAAYMNGEPDQALALRIRRLIDQRRGKDYTTQLQTGQVLDQLVQRELAYGSDAAHIPPGQLERMRNAAFLRFPEVTAEGRTKVTLAAPNAHSGPSSNGPLTQGQVQRNPNDQRMSVDPSAPTTATSSDVPMSVAPPPPQNPPDPLAPRDILAGLDADQRAAQGQHVSGEDRNALHNGPNELSSQSADTADEAAAQATTLREAQDAVVAYMNRPLHTHDERAGMDWRQRDLENIYRHDSRHPQVNYDETTGKVTVSPAAALQSYNQALIRFGSSHPITRGRAASATIARIPGNQEPSENQINLMNDTFTDPAYNQMRIEWDNATPRERRAMRDRWEQLQEDHRLFLRTAAAGMIAGREDAGLTEGDLDDAQKVEDFLTNELGDRFGEVGSSFRQAGRQIISKGRIDIDTGMRLAAEGWGTNEALMQTVMANRSDHEWNARRANGETMRSFAHRTADDELSGDDWQDAREKLRGEDTDDLERADTLDFLIDQQLEDGTGWLSSLTMADSQERNRLVADRGMVDERLEQAALAGMAEARRRGADLPDLGSIQPVRMPGGGLNPLIKRYALDGDGSLRGAGHSLSAMGDHVRQSTRFYKEEIASQEAVLTGIITAVAVIASVLAMLIPGVNAAVAGIWIALLSGAATVAVKAGMRGNRYGWEEAAVDVGTAAVEAATAGASGALSKGAQLGAAAKAAALADDAVKAAEAAEKIGKLGRVARVGASLGERMGGKAAGVVTEMATSVASGTANAAMNDEMWRDGMGTGLLRLAGHGAQAGISSAISSGLNHVVQGGLDKRLKPFIGDPATVGKLTLIGRGLSPNARELLTDTVSGLAGSLGAEGVNLLADVLRHPDKMKQSQILERLGKTGLRELFTTLGKTSIKQQHRARYNEMVDGFVRSGRTPNEADLILMNKLAESGGVRAPGGTPEDIGTQIARTQEQVRLHHETAINAMPAALQPFLRQMRRDQAMEVMTKVQSGDLGSDDARAAFAKGLSSEIEGFDPAGFDAALGKARDDHAAAQSARQAKVVAAKAAVFGQLSPRAQAQLRMVPMDGLADLAPDDLAALAKRMGEGQPLDDVLAAALKDRPEARDALAQHLTTASKVILEAQAEDARVKARIDDDLAVAIPKDLQATLDQLSGPDRAALHVALSHQDTATAETIFRKMGLSPEAATRVAGRAARHIEAQQVRRDYMDNVPAAHRETMAQLTPDMLMEIRVAQFTKTPLPAARVAELLAEAKARRPNLDTDTLHTAITATMATVHGRPGFRQGWAQKRALLDLVPAGMKLKVLGTPVITLDDDAFFAFVKGSGSENAVTLIVNGKPVVLMRAGADPSKLGEEGLHVLQYHDPEFRSRLQGLEERRIARWEELDFDGRMTAFETKIDVEIDAQRRTIARLERRVQTALLSSTKTQALRQLELAHEHLDALTGRKNALGDLSPEIRAEMRLGLRPEPKWLNKPARMFNVESESEKAARMAAESDAELDEILRIDLPAPRKPVVHELRQALKRTPGLSRNDKRRLVGLLRTLKGAVAIEDMVLALKAMNRTPPAKGYEHLAGIHPDTFVDVLQTHLFDTRFETEAGWKLQDRRHEMQRILADKTIDGKRVLSEARARKLLTMLLTTDGDAPELAMAKQAMFLSLEYELDNPRGRSHAQLRERLHMVEAILNLGPKSGHLKGLAARPQLQAFALEAMATTKTLMEDADAPRATQDGLIKAINHLTAHGIDHFSETQQRSLFHTLARAYYDRNDDAALLAIGNLPQAIIAKVGPAGRAAAGEMMSEILDMLSRHSIGYTDTMLGKLQPFLALAVDYAGMGNTDQVTILKLQEYVAKATGDLQFAKSLIRIAGRMQAPGGGKDPMLLKSDIAAIEAGRQVAGQAEFLDRHSQPMDQETGRGVDIEQTREQVAADLQTTAALAKVDITREEARAIAKRIEVLDQSALFSGLTQDPKSRAQLIETFLATLQTDGGFAPPVPTSETALNTRGTRLEKLFRTFVRDSAVAAPSGILTQIFRGSALPGQTTPLSKAARTELILILVRGSAVGDLSHVDAEVAQELDAAFKSMIQQYLDLSSDSLAPILHPQVEADLRRMLAEGIIRTEVAAKGKMLEAMFEGLLRLHSGKDGDPPLFDDLTSLSNLPRPDKTSKLKRTEFEGFDAKDGDKLRSADHVIQVSDQATKLPPGIKPGDAVAVDSKNGPGAFQEDQFKRYLVDMIKGMRGEEGHLFAHRDSAAHEDGTGLSALIYLSDSPETSASTRAKAAEVLRGVLDAAKQSGGIVTFKIDDATFDIPLSDLQALAPDLVVHFGRLSTAGMQPNGGHQLGPITLQDDGDMVARVIEGVLAQKAGQTPPVN